MGMCRNCAAEHSRSDGASGSWLLGENVAKRATEEARRTDLFGDKANNDEPVYVGDPGDLPAVPVDAEKK